MQTARARYTPGVIAALTSAAVEALAQALPGPGLPDLYPLQHRVHAGLFDNLELDGRVLRFERSQFLTKVIRNVCLALSCPEGSGRKTLGGMTVQNVYSGLQLRMISWHV